MKTDATVKDIRQAIKALAAQELERLPETLEGLTPPERAKFLLSLLPYAAPKVETCQADYGEGGAWL